MFLQKRLIVRFLSFFLLLSSGGYANDSTKIVNDVTQLNPVEVYKIIAPHNITEIIEAVKKHPGPISIGGGRYSMGGQTATEQALQIDMRQFNKVIAFSKERKEITIQAGITWRQVQEYIDPHQLSIKIKQTYSNFTVGGSLSVNVHGRYIGLGPLILSVISIKVILPDGRLVLANPKENSKIFYGVIGGYGALGVIAEATLSLTDNVKVARKADLMPLNQYKAYFFNTIRDNQEVVFHNGDIYPEDYTQVHAVSFVKTDKPLTITERLIPLDKDYWLEKTIMWIVSEMPYGKWFRQHIVDPLVYSGNEVKWRNYEASYDVKELEPSSRKESTYVLQEYFVPVDQFDAFVPKMAEIFNRHGVNVINVSIRHARQDPGSLLAWAKTEVFAFVVYYKQGTKEYQKKAVAVWTRELIDAAISLGGAYYLPYQIHATSQQFHDAYPKASDFFKLKKELDPTNKFRNKLWDAYYLPSDSTAKSGSISSSRFKAIFNDKMYSDGIYKFLQNVYGLYPTDKFHHLIKECVDKYETDQEIYLAIQQRLPEVTPSLWAFRYALPALSIQKKEISTQTATLLGDFKNINGYLEIGTTGRYVNSLKGLLNMKGPVYLSYYEHPDYGPQDIMERGQITKIGTFFDQNKYEPISAGQVPDTSLDLVTIYIGLHHCPSDKADTYVKSIWRTLRPGGKIIIRDHNVSSPGYGKFVSVIHDVFYCGLGETWEYTNGEIRNFTSTDSLTRYMEKNGFKADSRRLLQKNDPSLNSLLMFTKTEAPSHPADTKTELINIKGYKRDEAQTYLTFPEWYLVYSPDEYAQYLKTHNPSGFPYFGAIRQFWGYYRDVYNATKTKYVFNGGYHLMVFVIGTSYTLENVIKGVYENTFGLVSEWIRGDEMTSEDHYAARIAQEYVDFIRVYPWYEFPFYDRLKKLWSENDLTGKNNIRKWERKFILSAEYGGKSVYAYLIGLGSKAVYGYEDTRRMVWAEHVPAKNLDKRIEIIRQFPDSSMLLSLPCFDEFKEITSDLLVNKNVSYKEIAGNELILISCIAPSEWKYNLSDGKVVFGKPILTAPHLKRVAIEIPVNKMHLIFSQLEKLSTVRLEHIYDY